MKKQTKFLLLGVLATLGCFGTMWGWAWIEYAAPPPSFGLGFALCMTATMSMLGFAAGAVYCYGIAADIE